MKMKIEMILSLVVIITIVRGEGLTNQETCSSTIVVQSEDIEEVSNTYGTTLRISTAVEIDIPSIGATICLDYQLEDGTKGRVRVTWEESYWKLQTKKVYYTYQWKAIYRAYTECYSESRKADCDKVNRFITKGAEANLDYTGPGPKCARCSELEDYGAVYTRAGCTFVHEDTCEDDHEAPSWWRWGIIPDYTTETVVRFIMSKVPYFKVTGKHSVNDQSIDMTFRVDSNLVVEPSISSYGLVCLPDGRNIFSLVADPYSTSGAGKIGDFQCSESPLGLSIIEADDKCIFPLNDIYIEDNYNPVIHFPNVGLNLDALNMLEYEASLVDGGYTYPLSVLEGITAKFTLEGEMDIQLLRNELCNNVQGKLTGCYDCKYYAILELKAGEECEDFCVAIDSDTPNLMPVDSGVCFDGNSTVQIKILADEGSNNVTDPQLYLNFPEGKVYIELSEFNLTEGIPDWQGIIYPEVDSGTDSGEKEKSTNLSGAANVFSEIVKVINPLNIFNSSLSFIDRIKSAIGLIIDIGLITLITWTICKCYKSARTDKKQTIELTNV